MKKQPILFLGCLLFLLLFMSATIDLDNLFNYENQSVPNYIRKDNTTTNSITNEQATLGRVLFYDKNLSVDNTIACASCHTQENAFSDTDLRSTGVDGLTGRHSMRLINARFADEDDFFWDERANTLEDQTTQPIQDHIEMGFSGANGDPDIDDLISKLEDLDHYQKLFDFAYGNTTITETRIQNALAQFIRSIQSFDSKFDVGLAQTGNIDRNFPNYTNEENTGKQLFLSNRGANCVTCHRAPEFDIDPNSRNNGVIGVLGSNNQTDLTNTRSPSLRDLVNPNGEPNGAFMHDGSLPTLLDVVNHYDDIPNDNANLDNRLRRQNLNLSNAEKNAVIAFLETLTGNDVYTNEKWSDPFDADGTIVINDGTLSTQETIFSKSISVYPNPVINDLNIRVENGNYNATVFDTNGKEILNSTIEGNKAINLSAFQNGMYIQKIKDLETKKTFVRKFIKR